MTVTNDWFEKVNESIVRESLEMLKRCWTKCVTFSTDYVKNKRLLSYVSYSKMFRGGAYGSTHIYVSFVSFPDNLTTKIHSYIFLSHLNSCKLQHKFLIEILFVNVVYSVVCNFALHLILSLIVIWKTYTTICEKVFPLINRLHVCRRVQVIISHEQYSVDSKRAGRHRYRFTSLQQFPNGDLWILKQLTTLFNV